MSSPLGERGLPPFNQQVTAAGPSDNVHQGGLIDWHGTGKGRAGITAKEKGGGCPTLSRMEDSSRTAQLFHGVCVYVCMCAMVYVKAHLLIPLSLHFQMPHSCPCPCLTWLHNYLGTEKTGSHSSLARSHFVYI